MPNKFTGSDEMVERLHTQLAKLTAMMERGITVNIQWPAELSKPLRTKPAKAKAAAQAETPPTAAAEEFSIDLVRDYVGNQPQPPEPVDAFKVDLYSYPAPPAAPAKSPRKKPRPVKSA